jgi:hypothetical protein
MKGTMHYYGSYRTNTARAAVHGPATYGLARHGPPSDRPKITGMVGGGLGRVVWAAWAA